MSNLLNALLPVLIALGVVYLVFGIVQYFIGDDAEAKTKGKDKIVFGLIGLTVIVAIWGLVYMVVYTFDIDRDNLAPQPDEIKDLLPKNTGGSGSN